MNREVDSVETIEEVGDRARGITDEKRMLREDKKKKKKLEVI